MRQVKFNKRLYEKRKKEKEDEMRNENKNIQGEMRETRGNLRHEMRK